MLVSDEGISRRSLWYIYEQVTVTGPESVSVLACYKEKSDESGSMGNADAEAHQ